MTRDLLVACKLASELLDSLDLGNGMVRVLTPTEREAILIVKTRLLFAIDNAERQETDG